MGRVIRTRRIPGRARRGYGLVSLIVLMFFVSILVTAIAEQVGRETSEARADAAFNHVRDRLHAYAVTGSDPADLLPHLQASRDVQMVFSSVSTNLAARAIPRFQDERAAALYDQKLRAFLNLPNGEEIPAVSPQQIRRQYPERVLRHGDRMAVPLVTTTITGLGTLGAGAGRAETAKAQTLLAGSAASMGASSGDFNILSARSFQSPGRVSGASLEIAGSLKAPALSAPSLSVEGRVRADRADFDYTQVLESFAPENLKGAARLTFDTLVVKGLRSTSLSANALSAGTIRGGRPGPLKTPVSPVLPPAIPGTGGQ